MKSFGLWLLSVTLLGITLGCAEEKKDTPPPADPPADAPTDPAP